MKSVSILILMFLVGVLTGVGIALVSIKGPSETSATAFYKVLLWDVYDDYAVAMRDMEAAADLIKANYYAQHLQYPYRGMWALDRPSPKFYAEDAMKQLDEMLERLTKTDWPDEFKDEVAQLQTYVAELRQLVLRIQEIANKDTYTQSDVDNAEAILDLFHDYNDKIHDLIKNAP